MHARFRDQLTAAPLKPPNSAPRLPTLRERFRDQLIAAPLKQDTTSRARGYCSFRDQLIAAPLKPANGTMALELPCAVSAIS